MSFEEVPYVPFEIFFDSLKKLEYIYSQSLEELQRKK